MRWMAVIGVVLILLGALALAYQGISYTTEEEILDVGPLEASKETERTIPLPPILGAGALAAGVLLLLASRSSGRT